VANLRIGATERDVMASHRKWKLFSEIHAMMDEPCLEENELSRAIEEALSFLGAAGSGMSVMGPRKDRRKDHGLSTTSRATRRSTRITKRATFAMN